MKSNLNPLSPSGTINRKSFFLTEIILVSISSLLMYMAENQAPYMTNLGRILYIAVSILLSLGMIFAAIKRCREVGISVWWSALLVVPIVFLFIVGYLTFAKARPENKSGNHLIEGQVQVDSVEQENPSTSTEVLPKMQNDEVQSSTSSSIWDKLSGPLMMLVMLAYFAYYLVGLGLFGGFVCWFLDTRGAGYFWRFHLHESSPARRLCRACRSHLLRCRNTRLGLVVSDTFCVPRHRIYAISRRRFLVLCPCQ